MRHKERVLTFWLLQAPGWLLLLYLIYAQAIPAFGYDIGVKMGTQEPVEMITEVGAAFWYGFALGDLLTYIPILLAGLIGHMLNKDWGRILFAAAMGISFYWPVVCLVTISDARDAAGWSLSNESQYWIVLPFIAIWGAWGLWALSKEASQRNS